MTQEASKFHISKDHVQAALQNARQILTKPGTSWTWVDSETLTEADTLQAFMKEWCWFAETDAAGNIVDVSFHGEKLGNDIQLFKALAPFVNPGSYIVMFGEDGAKWRWLFTGNDCVEQEAQTTFSDILPGGDVIDVAATEVKAFESRRLLR